MYNQAMALYADEQRELQTLMDVKIGDERRAQLQLLTKELDSVAVDALEPGARECTVQQAQRQPRQQNSATI